MSKVNFRREDIFDLIGKTFYYPSYEIGTKRDVIVVNGKEYFHYDYKNTIDEIRPVVIKVIIDDIKIDQKGVIRINSDHHGVASNMKLIGAELYSTQESAEPAAIVKVQQYLDELTPSDRSKTEVVWEFES